MRAPIPHPFPCRLQAAVRLALACACPAVAGLARGDVYTPPSFSHYQPILDRMPFGALPANFGAVQADAATLKSEAQVKAEQQTLAKKVNMSAVNITPEGQTAIGFTDLSVNPPVNYYLLVGAVAGGWTVVNADYDEETATIEKDGVAITLKLGQGLIDPASLPAKAAAAPRTFTPAAGAAGKAALPLTVPSRPHLSRPTSAPVTNYSNLPRGAVHQMSPAAAVSRPEEPQPPDTRSYAERQRDRAAQQTQAQQAAEEQQRAQLEKLAREAASNEIKRREAEAQLQQAVQPDEPQPQQEQPAQQEQ